MAYPGGKSGSGVYQTIINLMPPHRIYIEPFLGGGAIMRLKRPAQASIGLDLDPDVIAAWKGHDIPGLEIIQANAMTWLSTHPVTPDTLIYLDPPYLLETRSCKRNLYRHEFYTRKQHRALLDLSNSLDCMVMISGYYSDLYASALSNWRSVHYQARTRGGNTATEWIWLNFPEPLQLHDYRYLGENFRERERIKRKKDRWKNRLLNMDPLERHAVLSAIDELRSSTSRNGDACWRPSSKTAMAPGHTTR